MSGLIVIGAGGHGRVVADAAQASNRWSKIVFLDDKYPDLTISANWNVIGKLNNVDTYIGNYEDIAYGTGSNKIRISIHDLLSNKGFTFPVVIHPRAVLSDHVEIGNGSVVFANVAINIGANIGEICIINTGATIDHDCKLGRGVHISPGVNMGGDVIVGEGSWIGIGASVKSGITIGENVIVGAGAAVVSDIPDNMTVVGVPAKPIDNGSNKIT